MSTAWNLYYHPGFAGRAEFIRILFEDAGTKFNEINDSQKLKEQCHCNGAKISDTWPIFAPPILEKKGGVKLSQTPAMCKYLGGQLGYWPVPANPVNDAKCDQVNLTIHDYFAEFFKVRTAAKNDPENAGDALDSFKDRYECFMSFFESCLKANGGGSGLYLVGQKGFSINHKAMLRDVGSRDQEFIEIVAGIRSKLLDIAMCNENEYTTVLLQGSGTFAIEAVLATILGKGGKALIISNGAYAERMTKICVQGSFDYEVWRSPESKAIDLTSLETKLANHGSTYAVVCCVHYAMYFLDAMSSFGAYPINLKDLNIDFLVSSANKCLQGVPGFSFVIGKQGALERCRGHCSSWCLDLHDQWMGLEMNGQLRSTPPTHSILAFYQALKDHASHIITSFYYPRSANFDFTEFYRRLSDRGQIIYPGKLTKAECFRIGNIGHLFKQDFLNLLDHVDTVLHEMNVVM